MILIGKMQLKKLLKRILKKFGLVVILIWHQILAIVNNLQVNVWQLKEELVNQILRVMSPV